MLTTASFTSVAATTASAVQPQAVSDVPTIQPVAGIYPVNPSAETMYSDNRWVVYTADDMERQPSSYFSDDSEDEDSDYEDGTDTDSDSEELSSANDSGIDVVSEGGLTDGQETKVGTPLIYSAKVLEHPEHPPLEIMPRNWSVIVPIPIFGTVNVQDSLAIGSGGEVGIPLSVLKTCWNASLNVAEVCTSCIESYVDGARDCICEKLVGSTVRIAAPGRDVSRFCFGLP